MRLSRDEAREIAAVALMLAIGFRAFSGLVRWLDDLDSGGGVGTFVSTAFEPVGSTMAILTLGLALLVVLSPPGAISMKVRKPATITAALVTAGSVIIILNRLVAGGGSILGRIWFTMLDKFPALILAGAALYILGYHDSKR